MTDPSGKGPVRGEPVRLPARRRRWRSRLIVAAALVILLVLLIPYVGSTGPVRRYVVSKVNGQLAGRFQAEGLSLSWLGPCEVRGVKLSDKDGREVLTAEKVTLAPGLWHMLTSWQDLESVDVTSAHVLVSVGPDWRISLVEALGRPKPAAPPPPVVTLPPTIPTPTLPTRPPEVPPTVPAPVPKPTPPEPPKPLPELRGTVRLKDASVRLILPNGRTYDIAKLDAEVTLNTLSEIHARLAAKLAGAEGVTASLDATELFRQGELRPLDAVLKLDVSTDGSIQVGPIVNFAAGRTDVSGKVKLRLHGELSNRKAEGTLQVELADFRSAELEAADVRPVSCALDGTFTAKPDELAAVLKLTGEPGRFDTKITYRPPKEPPDVSLGELLSAALGGHTHALPDFTLTMHGGIDLGALGRAVPALLRVRPDVTITSGRLDVTELSIQGGLSPTAKGVIELTELAAVRGGTAIRFDPLHVDFDALVAPEKGLEVRSAGLKSGFMQIEGAGGLDKLEVSFQADLAALYQQVSRVFDMGSLELAGKTRGRLQRSRVADRVNVELTLAAEDFRYKQAKRLLQFRTAAASVVGNVQLEGHSAVRYTVEKASLDLDGETSANLSGWMDRKGGGLHAELGLARGELATLVGLVRALGSEPAALASWGGALQADVKLDRAGADAPFVSAGAATLVNPTFAGQPTPAKKIALEWNGVQLDPKAAALALNWFKVDASDATTAKLVTASASGLRVGWGKTPTLSGKTYVLANLGQLLPTVRRALGRESLPALAGTVTCSAEFTSTAIAPEAGVQLSVKSTGTAAELVIPTGKTSRRIPAATFILNGHVELKDGKPARVAASEATVNMPEKLHASAFGWYDRSADTLQADVDVKYADIAVLADWLSAFDLAQLKRYAGTLKLHAGLKRDRADGPFLTSGAATLLNPIIDGAPTPAKTVAIEWNGTEVNPKTQRLALKWIKMETLDATGGKLASASAADAGAAWGSAFSVSGRAYVGANLGQTLVILRQLTGMEKLPTLAGSLGWSVELTPSPDAKAVAFKSSGQVGELYMGAGNTLKRVGTGTFSQTGRIELKDRKPSRVVATETTTSFPGTLVASASGWYDLSSGTFQADIDAREMDIATLSDWAEAFGIKHLKGLGGALQAKGGVKRGPGDAVTLGAGTANIRELTLDGRPTTMKNVAVQWNGVALSPSAGQVAAKSVKLDATDAAAASVATASASDAAVSWLKALAVNGKTYVAADLGQVSPVLRRLVGEDKLPALEGKLTWSVSAAPDAGAIALVGNGAVNNTQVGTGERAFRDRHVEFAHDLRVNPRENSVTLQRVAFVSTPLSTNIVGTIRQWTTTREVNIQGTYQGTWEQILPLIYQFSPGLADHFVLAGPATGRFTLLGPANDPKVRPPWRGLVGSLQAGWTSGNVYGVPVGQAVLSPTLGDGQVMLPVTEIASGDGKIRLGFVLDLRTPPATFRMTPRLQAVENLYVSHDFKWGMLAKLNPILVGDVEGRVSLMLDDLVCPLGEHALQQMTGHGRLDLAQFKMKSDEPTGLAGKLFSIVDLGEGQVHDVAPTSTVFTIRNGRIEYEDFSLVLDNKFEMRFSGWVGLDDSIDMTVTVPASVNFLSKMGLKIPFVDMVNLRVPIHLTGKRSSPKVTMGKVLGAKFDGSSLTGPLDSFLNLVKPK